MFRFANLSPDDETDSVGKVLKMFRGIPTWTKEKRKIHDELVSLLKKSKYEEILLNTGGYEVGKIGTSGMYKVPLDKKGIFSKFQGKTVRIICIQSFRFRKVVMVKVI
jgi:hypothetical protein